MCENGHEEGVFTILLQRGACFTAVDVPAIEPGTLEEKKGVMVRWHDEEGLPHSVAADVLEVQPERVMGGVVVDPYRIKPRRHIEQLPPGATIEPAPEVSPLEALAELLFESEAGEEVLAGLERWYGLAMFPVPGGFEFVQEGELADSGAKLRETVPETA